MKSIVKEPNKSTVKIVYPCAFRYVGKDANKDNVGNFIVLATNETTGVVIYAPENCKYGIGYFCALWADFDDKAEWELFTNEIELDFSPDDDEFDPYSD
jgi:hypothetical protein